MRGSLGKFPIDPEYPPRGTLLNVPLPDCPLRAAGLVIGRDGHREPYHARSALLVPVPSY